MVTFDFRSVPSTIPRNWEPEIHLPRPDTGPFDFTGNGQRTSEHQPQNVERYYDDPVGFARDCIDWPSGQGLTPYQVECLGRLTITHRLGLRGPHGLGKTLMEALIALWFALTRDATPDRGDWKIVTTAGGWRQLTHYLWPEIRKWAYRLKPEAIGRGPLTSLELLRISMKLAHGEAFAAASSEASLIEGAHADRLLYLFDESKSIADEIFDAAEGALATGDCYAVAASTPGEPVGRFYDIHRRKAGYEDWDVRHVTVEEMIASGRIAAATVEQRRLQWGEQSAVFQNRMLGEFAASEENGVIPLAWVELANERWQEWHEVSDGRYDRLDAIGTDVAAGGQDKTVHALRAGEVCVELRRQGFTNDTMSIVGVLSGIQDAHGGLAVIDAIGVGAGAVHRMRELGRQVEGFVASEASFRKDISGELGFANRRAEGWWNMREMLDPANGHAVALPPDDQLTGDLTTPRWRVLSGGKILIESKDDIRARIGRSTDDGDAVVQAYAPLPRRLVGAAPVIPDHPRAYGQGGGSRTFGRS